MQADIAVLAAGGQPRRLADPRDPGGHRPARDDLVRRRAAGGRDVSASSTPAPCRGSGCSTARRRASPRCASASPRSCAAIGLACAPEQILVLSGSQQGIDLVGKLFVDDGTPVAVEAPTYLAALQVFRYFGARFVTLDPQRPDGAAARSAPARLRLHDPHVPESDRALLHGRRSATRWRARATTRGSRCSRTIPYRDLVYDACERTPVCARLERASWIYQGSFSKSLAPGLRLGFLAASPDLVHRICCA